MWTCNNLADMRESCPIETLKGREVSAFFFFTNHAAKAAPIASATGSVRLTGSPSTPSTATPRISLYVISFLSYKYNYISGQEEPLNSNHLNKKKEKMGFCARSFPEIHSLLFVITMKSNTLPLSMNCP